MKKILKIYLTETVSLYLVTLATQGIILEKGLESLFLAGVGLSAAALVIRPIINLLILPLNLVTFGFFRWISSTIVLYLVTLLVPGFKISKFYFGGLATQWFSLPPITLSGILAYIGFSLVLLFCVTTISWLIK